MRLRFCRYFLLSFVFLSANLPAWSQVNLGSNFQSQSTVSFTPPDTMGAIGPNQWVQFTNDGYTVFNKAGTVVAARVTATKFWQNAGLTNVNSLSDPRIIYDPLSARFYAVMISVNEATDNRILIARSNTSNPLNGFKAVTLATTNGQFADYPTLGVDRNGLMIGTNNFDATGTSFLSVGMYTVPKADLLLNTPTVSNFSKRDTADYVSYGFTPQGVNNFNLGQTTGASSTSSFLAVSTQSATQLNFTNVTGIGAAGATISATPTNINVGAFSTPLAGRQPTANGTAVSGFTMDSIDERIGSSIYRVGNFIYAVHGTTAPVSGTNQAAVIVTVLNANTNALIAETTLSEAHMDYYVPSIAANARGDLVVGYTRSGFVSNGSSLNAYPSAYASVGTFDGTTFSFGSPTLLKKGLTEYGGVTGEATSPATVRWGDYSTVRIDPTDPGIFWSTQEFVSGTAGTISHTWATQTTEIIPTVAGEVRWGSAANGSFGTASNWFNSTLPGVNDHVIFSRNGDGTTSYTVTMPSGSTSNDRASVRQGNVIWSLPSGSTYNLTNTGAGTSDSTGAVVSPASLAIAEYQGTANLTVSGGGTLNTVATTIAAGLNSEGTGIVSTGSLTITGTGTAWNNTGSLYLGGNATLAGGTGTLSVLAGASATIGGTTQIWNTASGITVGSVASAATFTTGGLTNANGTTPTVNLVNAGSSLVVNGNIDSTFSGTIAGAGTVTKQGTGTFTASGTNTYTGATNVLVGTLAAGSTSAFGVNSATTVNGTLALKGFNNTIGSLSGLDTGVVTNNGVSATLTINTSATTTFPGIIQDGTGRGNLALTKAGTGTQILAGDNTYNGPTAVLAGTLQVNGSTSASSVVNVTGTGVLSGRGIVAGPVTITSGGTIAPGVGIGTLSTGAVTFDVNGRYQFNFNSIAGGTLTKGVQGSWLDSSGDLTFTATQANPFTINLTYTGSGSAANGLPTTAILATFATAPSLTATQLSNDFIVTGDVLLGSGAVSISGNDLILTFTPVPEPMTMIGITLGVSLAGAGIRRRIASRATA